MSTADLLAGRYELGGPIGRGRSTVYQAEDTRLRRRVAVKQVQIAAGDEDPERVRTRALREAQAAARLNNPGVVTVYDVIEEGGSIWLVMELVDAPSLAQVVADEGPLDHARAAHVGLKVLDALESAHEMGIVHRDVKPANVLVGGGAPGRIKLTDFGVATIRGESRVTATGLVVGSPSYMSPEQARGEVVGPPADLWALGALLYFAVEGHPPFDAGTALATASAVVHGEPRPQLRPGPLDGIIGRLLMKDPRHRPQAGAVRTALAAAADADRTAVAAPAPRSNPSSTLVAPAADALARASRRSRESGSLPPTARQAYRRSRVPPMATMLALALLIMGVGAWGLWGTNGEDDGSEAGGTTTTSHASDASAAGQPGDKPDTATEPHTTEPQTTSTTGATATTAAAPQVTVPTGWTAYRDSSGYSIAYPQGWQVEPAGGPRIDFRDPATGTYLRVDWTDEPKDDPVADWQQQAEGFASRHEGYEEIRIEPYDYRDYNAAVWEFRYTVRQRLHVANIGFVTGTRGYALYFQAPETEWAARQEIFAQFRESFYPAA